MTEIAWRRGKFLKFYAAIKIRVGGENSLDIHAGDEFEYDGSVVKYAGAEFPQLGVRGAIASGWANLDPASSERIEPVVPVRDIAKSQSRGEDLSRVQRTKSSHLSTDSLDEETVLNVSDRRPDVNTNPRAVPNRLTQENNRRKSTAGQRVNPMHISQSDIDQQHGVVVGSVPTSAKLVVDDITKESNLTASIENRGPVKPKYLASNKKTIEREGVTITTNVGDMQQSIKLDEDDSGKHVGTIRKTIAKGSEGISIKDTSNIRNEKKVQAKSEKIVKSTKNLSPKHKIAISFYPDFPVDWNFVAPVKNRIAEMKKKSDDPKFLMALYAVEGDNVKKVIEKQFPGLFS